MDDEVKLPVTIENCVMLEDLDMSYEEMAKRFNVSTRYIRVYFCRNKIKHKNVRERLSRNPRILQKILFVDSVKKSAIKHNVSTRLIKRIRKDYKMKLDTKILKALSVVIKEEGCVHQLTILKELLEHTTAEIIYRPENFSSNVIWGLLVELYGDYNNELKSGWLNAFEYRAEIIEVLNQLISEA